MKDYFFIVLGIKDDFSTLNRPYCGLGERTHRNEPLRKYARLKHSAALVAEFDAVFVCYINLLKETGLLEVGYHFLSRFGDTKAFILPAPTVQFSVLVDDLKSGKIVPLCHVEVVRIVSRCDFHDPCPKCRVDVVVGDDFEFDRTNQSLKLNLFANPFFIALVIRVHGKSCIAEFGFRTHGGDCKWPVAHIVEWVGALLCCRFEFREGCLMFGTPVHTPFSTVGEAFTIEFLESFVDGFYNVGVEGELLAAPVARCPQLSQLIFHKRFVGKRKLKDLRTELVGVHSEARPTLFFQLFFIHNLCFKSRVVGSREPERFFPLHPLVADNQIFNGNEDTVACVERPIRVRRRHDDGERFLVPRGEFVGVKKTALFPESVDIWFSCDGVVGFPETFVHLVMIAKKVLT